MSEEEKIIQTLEEDDEFEDFPVDSKWTEKGGVSGESLWEEDWEDDNSDEFSEELRKELEKAKK